MTLQSCIYSGWVMHRRLRPVLHHFRYRAWWLLLDLDEIDLLDRQLRLFSRGRGNLISFHDRDHGHSVEDLRGEIERLLATSGIAFDGGRIRLLCAPRVLGYQFNPLSIYFCHQRSGGLAAIVYEVHNTYGERHSYCLAAAPRGDGVVSQSADKRFYVSPFIDMEMRYDFRVAPPDESLRVGITGSQRDSPVIHAVLQAQRRELSDRHLLALLVTHPLVTWKVTGAIHFEALRLWWKGLAVRRHVPSASTATTATIKPEREHA